MGEVICRTQGTGVPRRTLANGSRKSYMDKGDIEKGEKLLMQRFLM